MKYTFEEVKRKIIEERQQPDFFDNYISLNEDETRIYYHIDDANDPSSFYFYMLGMASELSDEHGAFYGWERPQDLTVSILFHGRIRDEEIRHFYIGSEITGNKGYFFYPDIFKMISQLLSILRLAAIPRVGDIATISGRTGSAK